MGDKKRCIGSLGLKLGIIIGPLQLGSRDQSVAKTILYCGQ